MKSILQLRQIVIIFILAINTATFAQDEEPSGLLGENFSLESALESFKGAQSLEAFEEDINKEDNYIHNLDLNGDEKIDYISVNDYRDGDVHAIVLSALISQEESQDIAVIEIEKDGAQSATLQIVGDEDLYGKDMIVEPFDIEGTDEGNGPSADMTFERIVFNVWLWPSVRYIYGPQYVVYHSPWRWAYYPGWWTPRRPRAWSVWRPFSIRYTPRYRITPVRRVKTARVIYAPQRRVSKTVTVKHRTSITKARTTRAGSKRSTTTVAATRGPNGKVVAVKKKSKVKTTNGSVKSSTKTKVKATNGQRAAKGSKKTQVKKTKKGKTKSVKKTKKVRKKKT